MVFNDTFLILAYETALTGDAIGLINAAVEEIVTASIKKSELILRVGAIEVINENIIIIIVVLLTISVRKIEDIIITVSSVIKLISEVIIDCNVFFINR